MKREYNCDLTVVVVELKKYFRRRIGDSIPESDPSAAKHTHTVQRITSLSTFLA
jgi:hypothetical protein